MERRGHLSVTDLQQHLDQPGNAGGELQMADVRLDRADATGRRGACAEARFRLSREIGKGGGQRLDLDRIAERRAGAVRLDIADGARIEPCGAIGSAQQLGLRLRVGRGQGRGMAAVVFRRGADHGDDVVAVAFGRLQRLEEHEADALAPRVAVGRIGKRLGAPVGRQHARTRESDKASGRSRALMPPAIAASQWPERIASTARWTATNALEQAVSTATLGPWKS